MKKHSKLYWGLISLILGVNIFVGCGKTAPMKVKQTLNNPHFTNTSVHDPSIIKSDSNYYIIGSHMQLAKSKNLIQWQQISSNVDDQKMFSNIHSQLASAFSDANTDTFWAGDIEQLADHKYYMYYCACEGDNPTAVLGLAVADKVTGPYRDKGIFLRSGNAVSAGVT